MDSAPAISMASRSIVCKALHSCGSAVPALDPHSPTEPTAALPTWLEAGPLTVMVLTAYFLQM